MNQGKLRVVKQEMARVNVNILGISELKWTQMGEFNSDDHYIYYCGQESLRRKVMTNLDSIFKSRDITLPTKVHLIKAMVFPVVMYGCESCPVKKAERRSIDAFELWCWRRLLRVP